MSDWRTNPRSGRAHLVRDRRPRCGQPVPQGGVTWARTARGHVRCPDCRALEAGATLADLERERAHGDALAEQRHREGGA